MTRKQRRRQLDAARFHQAEQRRRLRAALKTVPVIASRAEIDGHMTERGFEQDMKTGKWKAARPEPFVRNKPRRGPSWAGIMKKRGAKGRR